MNQVVYIILSVVCFICWNIFWAVACCCCVAYSMQFSVWIGDIIFGSVYFLIKKIKTLAKKIKRGSARRKSWTVI